MNNSTVPTGWARVQGSSGQAHLAAEHVAPLVAVLLIEADEALRQASRFRQMYDSLPVSEGKDVLGYVRKMRVHWEARHGAYLALADTLAGRRYSLTHIRRAEAEALVRQAERTLLLRDYDAEERDVEGSEGAPQGDC